MACGEVVKVSQVIFCANVFHFRRDNKVYKIVWCPSCYRSHPDDIFHVKNIVDDIGFEWTQENYQGRFLLERHGNCLFITIQCDMCILILLTGRRSTGTK